MKCKAELRIGDDHGDNEATMICGLEVDHYGMHEERYPRNGGFVYVSWDGDDRAENEKGDRS